MSVVTRFAPSPTGDLHLGHAFAAWYAHTVAAEATGRYLVRIEDIDHTRCRPHFVERILEDLAWLGLSSTQPIVLQSQRMPHYLAALARLQGDGVVYPCFCTRARIRDEIAAATAAPQADHRRTKVAPDAPAAAGVAAYSGTCRTLSAARRAEQIAAGAGYAWRLDARRALAATGPLVWVDRRQGLQRVTVEQVCDPVIARKDVQTSYHLAVVVDDAAQDVTLVTRGEDLFAATHLHRLLYALLGLPVPVWHHHPVCRDANGRRFAKRSGAITLRTLRAAGHLPAQVLAMARRAAGDAGGRDAGEGAATAPADLDTPSCIRRRSGRLTP